MAETVNLVDLDIDQSELLKKITKLQEEITDLKTDTKELTTANKQLEKEGKKNTQQYKDNSKQIEVNKVQTKGLSTEYRDNQKTLVTLNSSETKQLGTLQKLAIKNKELRNETKTLDLTQKKGKERLTEINKELDKNNEFVKENADASKKQAMNIGNYGSALQGLPGPLGAAVSGMQGMAKAALAFIATPIGAVIAAIGLAIGALTSYFKRSEEGQNALTKVMKVFSAILDNFMDVVSNVGRALFKAFTKPKEAAEDLKNFIRGVGEFFKNTFGNVIGGAIEVFVGKFAERFAQAGLIWQKFKGLFVENAEGIAESQAKIDKANEKIVDGQNRIKEGAEAFGDAYDKVKAKVKSFYDEIKADSAAARQLADSEAKIRKQERFDIVNNAKLAKQSAKLRAEAEQLKLTNAEKSIELFSKSFDLDKKVIEAELNIARQKVANAKLNASLAKSDIETLDEIARLEADVENKRKSFDETNRQRTRRLNAIRLEAFKQEKEQLQAVIDLKTIQADEVVRANERILSNEGTTQDELILASQENTAIKLQLLAQESDLELAEFNKRLELKLISQEGYEQQVQLLKEDFANKSTQLLEEQSDFEKKLNDDVFIAKFEVAAQVAGAMGAMFEEHTVAAKFAAIAGALINTFLGATAAFAQTPGGIVIKSIAAGAATAMGLANVAKIRKVQKGGGGGGGASVPSAGGGQSSFIGSSRSRATQADGGLSTRGLTDNTINSVERGVERAMLKAPRKILVIEEVTEKQRSQKSVSKVATV